MSEDYIISKISLLEYYAGQALTGIMGHRAIADAPQKDIVQMAFEFAEAMTKEAEKRSM